MNRPGGVTLIAVLYFLGAAFLSLIGIALLVGSGLAATFGADQPFVQLLAGVGVAGAVVVFICVALIIWIGVGLMQLKNWARTVAIVLGVLGAVTNGFALIASMMAFEPFTFFINGVQTALNALIVWYLLKPEVKAAFLAR